jgi:hypothetical protein
MSDRHPHLHRPGDEPTLLEPEPAASTQGLDDALAAEITDRNELGVRLRRLVTAQPTFLDGWAHLAVWALDAGDAVVGYAFARTGYHRGLDRIRAAGWRGRGPVPWSHEPNRGFLRSLHALMRAADQIGEATEAQRCRDFLLQLDPEDNLGVHDLSFGVLPQVDR